MQQFKLIQVSALTGIISAAVAGASLANYADVQGKCYGAAKAGQNDCGSRKPGTHNCATKSTTDWDLDTFKLMTENTCKEVKDSQGNAVKTEFVSK